jgi:hypothetical protein
MARRVARVRELAEIRDRAAIVDEHIGHILTHAPVDEDGGQPHRSVQDLLEKLASQQFERGILMERFKMRGVVTKTLFEGDMQEYDLAPKAQS